MSCCEKCIYCQADFDPTRGAGDHIIPVQLGEFRDDVRFRRICPACNSLIGKSEQQMLTCGPESFFRDIVKPTVPKNRQRGKSRPKSAVGAPRPVRTIDCGDHRQLVQQSPDNANNVNPIDHIVIHDELGEEHFIRLYPKMRAEQLRERIDKAGIKNISKSWVHCDEMRMGAYRGLVSSIWPELEPSNLPISEVGVQMVAGSIKLTVNDHYFRAIAKMAFHYYLMYSSRSHRGDEDYFGDIRDFIMNGGDSAPFFEQKNRPQFAMPFGKLNTGGVLTPSQWAHFFAASEAGGKAVAYVQLFVGPGCIPKPHHVALGQWNSRIILPNDDTWAHVYCYDSPQQPGRTAGYVKAAQITQLR